MTAERGRAQGSPAPAASSSAAAANLGAKLEALLMLISRAPWPAWSLLGIAVVAMTFPRQLRQRSVAGLVLDDRLSIWTSRIVIVAFLVLILALCVFVLRALLRYMEQDRWPRRAGGIEMDEVSRTHAQLFRDADELSFAADSTRMLGETLAEARDTILLLQGELERVRPSDRNEDVGGSRRSTGE